MANIQVRVDEKLKREAQKVAAALGMEVATTIRIFLCQMVRDKALPFTPTLKDGLSSSAVTPESQFLTAKDTQNREEWLRNAVHVGLTAQKNNEFVPEQEVQDMFTKAGANVS